MAAVAIFSPCSSVPVMNITFFPNSRCQIKITKLDNNLFNFKKPNKPAKLDNMYLKASNGVSSDGGISAAHMRRGVNVVKRGCDDIGFVII